MCAGTTLTYFRHADWLGSSRLTTTTSRTVYSSLAYAPFGETYAESGTPDRSFTGQNQDTVQGGTAGLYDFLYREYALYSRWISPDPAGLKAASLSTPQSLNRYAYVSSNPLALIDRLGLNESMSCPFDMWDCGAAGMGAGLTTWDGDLVQMNAAIADYNSSGAAAIQKGYDRYVNSLTEWTTEVSCTDGSVHSMPGQHTREEADAAGVCSGRLPSALLAMYFVPPKDPGDPEKLKACISDADAKYYAGIGFGEPSSWSDIALDAGLHVLAEKIGKKLAGQLGGGIATIAYTVGSGAYHVGSQVRRGWQAGAEYKRRLRDCEALYGPLPRGD